MDRGAPHDQTTGQAEGVENLDEQDRARWVKLIRGLSGGGPQLASIYVVLHRLNGQEHLFRADVNKNGEPGEELLAVAGEDEPDPEEPDVIVSDRICLFKRDHQDAAGRWHYAFDSYTTSA